MTDDPLGPFHPIRSEPRGEFPPHEDLPGRRVLTADQAREIARAKLAEWIEAHGGRVPGRSS